MPAIAAADGCGDARSRCSVRATHHECQNTVCKLVSFTYGAGFPALWRHENINDATHDEFIPREFGKVPRQLLPPDRPLHPPGPPGVVQPTVGLPADYAAQPAKTDARFVLFAGRRNQCFLPDSQEATYHWLDAQRPGFHGLHVLADLQPPRHLHGRAGGHRRVPDHARASSSAE